MNEKIKPSEFCLSSYETYTSVILHHNIAEMISTIINNHVYGEIEQILIPLYWTIHGITKIH